MRAAAFLLLAFPLAAGLTVAASRPASAEDSLTAVGERKKPDGKWDFAVTAAADGSYTTTTDTTDRGSEGESRLGGGLALGYRLKGGECKTMAASQDVYWVRRGSEDRPSLTGTMHVCMDQVEDPDGYPPGTLVTFPRIVGGYELSTQQRPRFDAPGTLKRDEYSDYIVYFGAGAFERRDVRRRLTAARFIARADAILQGAEASVQEPSQGIFTLEIESFSGEWRRDSEHPVMIRAGQAAMRNSQKDVFLFDVTPFAITGWQLGAVRVGGDAAYTYGYLAARRLHAVSGGASIETDVGDLTLAVRARRQVLPAVDPIVMIDDRITGEARYPLVGGELTAGGFAATSLSLSVHDSAQDRRDFTGGGSFGFSRAIGKYVQWSAAIEAGRSFYPRFDQVMSDARTGTIVRASTHLEARLGH